jgi:hypothetical protein
MTQQRIDIVSTTDAEITEVDSLLKDIHRNYGYDFRSYDRALVERHTRLFLASKNCEILSGITPKLHSDK